MAILAATIPRWLAKTRSVNKIDAAVALTMAMGAAMAGEIATLDIYSMAA